MSLSEWLESEDFYNAMQRYMIAPMDDQREVFANFENVKRMIREKYSAVERRRDDLLADANRYRWLRDRLIAADFDWNETGQSVLIFEWPENVSVGGNCDMNIDAAIARVKGDAA